VGRHYLRRDRFSSGRGTADAVSRMTPIKFERGGDFVVDRFDALPPSVRLLMLAAEPPYRMADAIIFWEYFINNGEDALIAMMLRLGHRTPHAAPRLARTALMIGTLAIAVGAR
jgi:hypothetical protein